MTSGHLALFIFCNAFGMEGGVRRIKDKLESLFGEMRALLFLIISVELEIGAWVTILT